MADSKDFGSVNDRRASKIVEDGPAEPRPAQPASSAEEAQPKVAANLPPDPSGMPEMDFSTFVLSLATSAFAQLGLAPMPDESDLEAVDLPLARQTIDILGMLEQKTRGNLTDQEAGLLQSVLFDLRLQFVEVSTTQGSGGSAR